MTVSPVAAAPQNVRTAIEAAAARTGVDFSYLVATAYRESGFDPAARAGTSSAAGLFQFIEQTWLGMVKRHGAQHGMAAEARQVEETPGGRYRVADPAARRHILDLRYDPAAAAAMAGEYAAESAEALQARLGRAPTSSELYAAHFLGASGAARLIEAAEANPQARADVLFPDAARANRAIFRDGREPATVAQVLAKLSAAHGDATAAPGLRADRATALAAADANIPDSFIRNFVAEESARATHGFAPPRSPARVLSPLVIEALAALDTPGAAASGRKGRRA